MVESCKFSCFQDLLTHVLIIQSSKPATVNLKNIVCGLLAVEAFYNLHRHRLSSLYNSTVIRFTPVNDFHIAPIFRYFSFVTKKNLHDFHNIML